MNWTELATLIADIDVDIKALEVTAIVDAGALVPPPAVA